METIKSLVQQATSALNSTKTQSRQWPHLQPQKNALINQHGSIEDFMLANNPDEQKTVAQDEDRAIIGTSPMLCTIDAAYGEGSAAQWLIPQLHSLCAAVGVKTKLDDTQLIQLAQMIRDEFGNLKATEVMLFLWRLKGGHYCEFFGSVDIQRVMRALRGKFSEERADVIAKNESRQRNIQRRQREEQAATPEEIEKIKQRLLTNFKTKEL